MSRKAGFGLALLATAIPNFMVTLDNLVVTNALPVIKTQLGASLTDLEWVINAYTLSMATLLLTMSALGDRLGRRRVFLWGVVVFTVASALCALATEPWMLIAARAVQGVGGAVLFPLSLTLLATAVPKEKRAFAIGIWGAVGGLGVAVGPLVGGAVVEGLNWQWIFWFNVPVGVLTAVLVLVALPESRAGADRLDPRGVVLSGAGMFALVWGVMHAARYGWLSGQVIVALALGVVLLGAFAGWERRASAPMVPPSLFRHRGFGLTNAVTAAYSFGVFGAIFLLAQFFQVAQGLSPLESGIRMTPWTLAPLFVAPVAGYLAATFGARYLVASGLAMQAAALFLLSWELRPDLPYPNFVLPFVLSGVGVGLTIAPLSSAVLATVPDEEHGKASGTNNTIRELGVAFGVAVLTTVFQAAGDYGDPASYVDGLVPALAVGAAVVLLGAIGALAMPGRSTPTGTSVEDRAEAGASIRSDHVTER